MVMRIEMGDFYCEGQIAYDLILSDLMYNQSKVIKVE